MKRLIQLFCLFLVLTFSFQLLAFSCFAADKGLVAYWSFDEGSGDAVKDKSGNRLDGVIMNCAFDKGKVGNCLVFNGSDACIEVEHSEKLNFEKNTPMTFSFWINISDPAPQSDKDIISKADLMGGNFQRGYRILQTYQSSRIYFQLANERQPGDNYLGAETAGDIGEGWHHICITYKGDANAANVNFYVDGVPAAKKAGNNNLTDSIQNEKSLIMGRINDASNFFNGSLDEVKIYNRALTADEVKAEAGLK